MKALAQANAPSPAFAMRCLQNPGACVAGRRRGPTITRPSTATTAPRLQVPSFTLPNLQALHRIARRVARRIVEDRGDKKKGGEERRRRKIKRQTAIVTEELLSLLQKASGTSSSATSTSSSTTATPAQ